MMEPRWTSDDTNPLGRELRTKVVMEPCARCGVARPRRTMKVVELPVLDLEYDVPDSLWVCVDGQACMLMRAFPDLAC